MTSIPSAMSSVNGLQHQRVAEIKGIMYFAFNARVKLSKIIS
jgi:hypothetical protein